MAFSEIGKKRVEKAAEAYLERNRPPAHIREKVDMGYRVSNQSLEIFEIRPLWSSPKEKIEEQVAKATYVKKTDTWKIGKFTEVISKMIEVIFFLKYT